jgi:hypothetical protein
MPYFLFLSLTLDPQLLQSLELFWPVWANDATERQRTEAATANATVFFNVMTLSIISFLEDKAPPMYCD